MTINTRLEFDGAVANNARLQQVLDQLGGAISSLNGGSIGSPLTIVGPNNNMVLSGSSTGNPITLTATGSNTNINIKLAPKGGGVIQVGPDFDGGGTIDLTDFAVGRAGNPGIGFYQDLDLGPNNANYQMFGIQSSIGTIGATNIVDKCIGWELFATHQGNSVVCNTLTACHLSLNASGGGVTNAAFLDIDPSLGAGATNYYGIKIGNITTGTTLNFAIKTGLGKVQFGDVVNLQNLSASQVVTTDASKNLVSVAGTTTTVTTASLVGKTMTFTNGILTSFA